MTNKSTKILGLNKNSWNKIARKYEKGNYGKISSIIEKFCHLLEQNSLILDLGSGTGLPYDKYFIENGKKVIGIDISEEMIKISQKNVPEANYYKGSITEIDYRNNFEGVFACYSMLLLNPNLFEQTCKKIYDALKIGGYFFVELNEPEDGKKINDEEYELFVEIMGNTIYSRPYTLDEICGYIEPFGFKLIEIYREILKSKVFGTEHMLACIFQKIK